MEDEPVYDPDALGDGPTAQSALFAAAATTEQAVGRDPAQNEHTRWDEQKHAWIYTNPKDGSQYRWDPIQQFYVPDFDEDLLLQQQSIYGGSEPTPEPVEATAESMTKAPKPKKNKKRKREKVLVGDDGKKWAIPKQNRSIYITGLPPTITEQELLEYFAKVAIVERDGETGNWKVKVYRDPEGKPKGDGLVTFLRPEAVPLAMLRLDETEIKPGYQIKLTEAKYEVKEGAAPAVAKSSKKKAKRKAFDQTQELGWEERENRHLIIKHMFDPTTPEARSDVHFYDDLKSELAEELQSKLGGFEAIKIFERSPEGVVAVKFETQRDAEKCIQLMNGRYFGGQQLICEFYDGFTDYRVAEPDEDREARDKEWARFLGVQEQENSSSTAAAAATSVADGEKSPVRNVNDDAGNATPPRVD